MENQIKDFFINQNLTPLSRVFTNDNCPICFVELNEANLLLLHPCSHVICKPCYDSLPSEETIRKKCPMCRGLAKYVTKNNNNVKVNSAIPIRPRVRERNVNVEEVMLPSVMPVVSTTPSVGVSAGEEKITATYQIENYKDLRVGNLTIESNVLTLSSEHECQFRDYIFVIDTSGSMLDSLLDLQNTLISNCTKFSSTDRVSIITFSGHAKHLFALQPMTLNATTQLTTIVENMFASGSTNYRRAFELAFRVISEDYEKTKDIPIDRNIIFISDGQPDSPYDMSRLHADPIFQKYNLFSCSYGSSICADILKDILSDNENYRHFETSDELSTLMTTLGVNNQIIATDIVITTVSDSLSSTDKITIENPKNIRSVDLINIPFLQNSDFDNMIITMTMPDDREVQIIATSDSTIDRNFVIGSYLYKNYLNQINELKQQLDNNIESKIADIETRIEEDAEYLTLFKDDIQHLLSMIKSTIPSFQERNFTAYNRMTENIDISMSVRSPRVSSALRLSRRSSSSVTPV